MLLLKALLFLAAAGSMYCYTAVSIGTCIDIPIIPTFSAQSVSYNINKKFENLFFDKPSYSIFGF
jgi:hypothetical protein